MPHWIALLPGTPQPIHDQDAAEALADVQAASDALDALHLGWWCLQFTPRVALLEEAVVLEVQASERLFGGAEALRRRVIGGAHAHGVQAWAHAPTALAALALARHGCGNAGALTAPLEDAFQDTFEGTFDDVVGDDLSSPHPTALRALQARLDTLPLTALSGTHEHQPTLARLGCRTLADVRRLPRGGLSRRFGSGLLKALDQAYGAAPESFDWLVLPPEFDVRLELPGRVESAPALLFAANRLLHQLCAWLFGRQAGVVAFTLHWLHDWHRRDTDREGRWTVRLGSATRDWQRLSRLLAEHLQRIRLHAPVGDIRLHAEDIEALAPESIELFQEHAGHHAGLLADGIETPAAQRAQRDALMALLEKLSVRLGSDRVRMARLQADHRLECAQTWLPAMQVMSSQLPSSSPKAMRGHPAHEHQPGSPQALIADLPQPSWVLDHPIPLSLHRDAHGVAERPAYQGRLTMLAGPHRIEAGWWNAPGSTALVARDYYLASSPQAGLLWVYKMRHAPQDRSNPWHLHGFFA